MTSSHSQNIFYNEILESNDNENINEGEGPDLFSTPEIDSTENVQSNKRKKSKVWDHFEKIQIKNSNGVITSEKSICNYCKKDFAGGSKNGTSHLTRHLSSCLLRGQTDIRQTMLSQSASTGTLSTFSYEPESARKAIVRWIVIRNLPFVLVDDAEFERMLQSGFNPSFRKFSRQTCQRDVIKYYVQEKNNLIAYFGNLKSKICLTSDIWTSCQQLGYLCITAHFIDDNWVMQKRIITFTRIEDNHSAQVIFEVIYNQLQIYRIQDKIFTITLDNATNNSGAVSHLKCYLTLPCEGSFFHMRCMCHIINLIVQSGLHDIRFIIDKIRHIIYHIIGSENRLRTFGTMCKKNNLKCKKIPYDVQHRWNSTYKMLDVAVKYKAALNDYVSIDTTGSLSRPTEEE